MKEAYLSVGHLIAKYCLDHTCTSAAGSSNIKPVMEKMTAKIGECKSTDARRESMLLHILKGLRNSGQLTSVDKVLHCIGEHATTRVRQQAIATLAGGSTSACQLKVQKAMLLLLKNDILDAELRIEAYRTLVSCPGPNVSNEIKLILDDKTTSNQLGSYIQSHLASVRSSTDAYRESSRHHFANIRSTRRYPSDIRQYSFHQEYSYGVESLGVGAAAETSVVYSQFGWLPRSGRLNVTGQVFGTSFNLFELNGRQENLEHVFEHNFGPQGLFNTKTSQELYDLFVGSESHKNKRSIRPDIKRIAEKYKSTAHPRLNIEMDLSLKFFGSEMFFLSLGDNIPTDATDISKILSEWAKSLTTNAKSFSQKFESHSLFMDLDLVYTTAMGIPLRLQTQGTGAGRLVASGAIDIEAIRQNPKDTRFQLKLVPSYSLEVTGSLTADAFAVRTGFQITGSAHTSTSLEVNFNLAPSSRGFDAKFKTGGHAKQQILRLDHSIALVFQEIGQPETVVPMKAIGKETHNQAGGCFDQFQSVTGITICGKTSFKTSTAGESVVAAPIAMIGPNSVDIWLEVQPEYHLKAIYDDSNPQKCRLDVTFDFGDGQTMRTTKLQWQLSREPTKYFARITASATGHDISAEAGFVNDAKEFGAYGDVVYNQQQYMAKIGLKKSGSKGGTKEDYTPVMEVRMPKLEAVDNFNGRKLVGTVTKETFGKNGIRITFNNVKLVSTTGGTEMVAINGNVALNDDKRIDIDLKGSRADQNIGIVGGFVFKKEHVVFRLGLSSSFLAYLNGMVDINVETLPESVSLYCEYL